MAYPDVPTTGTVTTYTIGSTGDYATIAAFQTAIADKDLVTNTTSYILELQAENISENGTNLTGWTTNSTYYIYIRPVTGAEHNGVVGAGPIIRKTTNFGTAFTVSAEYTVIDGIEFRHEGSINLGAALAIGTSGSQTIKNSILSNGTVGIQGINVNSQIVNCLALDLTDTGFAMTTTANGGLIQNCLAYDCSTGISGVSTGTGPHIKNCCVYGASTASYSGTIDTGNSTNNAAGDASTTTPPGSNPITTNIVPGDFEGAVSDNFHLASGSTLIAAGADLTASGFTTDWEGDARPNGSAWDIGPDQYVADVTGNPAYYQLIRRQ
jgi:hypothetical protein